MGQEWIIGIGASVIGALALRTLANIDKNQKAISISLAKLWEDHNMLNKDFYQMKGQHEVNHKLRRSGDHA